MKDLQTITPQTDQETTTTRSNLGLGLLAGIAAAALSAALWGTITYITGYQIGWMAIGVGILVGWTIQKAGHGADARFGAVGAGLALLGCLGGNLLANCRLYHR